MAGAGISHAVGLVTGPRYGLPHGLAVGMVLPWSLELLSSVDSLENKFAEVGTALHSDASAHGAISGVIRISKTIGLPATLHEAREEQLSQHKELTEAMIKLPDTEPEINSLVEDLAEASINTRLLPNCAIEIGVDQLRRVIRNII